MAFDPLLQAPLIVQIHAFGAMAAVVLGLIQIIAPKGTLSHKSIGVMWIAIMTVVTISSAFITRGVEPGEPFFVRFSPIHLFTLLTAFGLVSGVILLLRGGSKFKDHSRPFVWVFIGGLVIAGALAFMPGRIMHEVAFGG